MIPSYKVTELGEIPESWDVVRLESVTTKIGDGLHATPKYVESSEYYFVNGNNLVNGKIEVKDNAKCVSEDEFNKYFKDFGDNTVLMSINGTIGNIAFYRGEKVIFGKSASFITCGQNLDKNFLFYLLQSSIIKKYYADELTGSTINNLSLKSIRNTPTPLPKKLEQKKIAAILSTVDEKIEVIQSQINQTQELKKGLMQQLLTKGIGHTKFKDSELGEIPESWNVVKLEYISERITKGTTPTTYGYSYKTEGINFIKIESILNNGSFKKEAFAYVDIECYNAFERSKLKENDILFSIAGALGRAAIVDASILPANTNQALAIITLKDKRNKNFIYHYLRGNYVSSYIAKINVQTAQANLNLSDLQKFSIPLPPLSEQIKITDILTTVYEKIEVLQAKKENFQELKKGLMQKLLTGKVRVKLN